MNKRQAGWLSSMRVGRHPFAFLIAAAIWMAASIGALSQETRSMPGTGEPKHADSQGGIPLAHYCTHVPDLTVNRPDAVDTWVKICTVYFNARTAPPGPPPTEQGSGKQQPAFKQLPPQR